MNSWRSTDIEVYITGDKKEIGWVKLPVSKQELGRICFESTGEINGKDYTLVDYNCPYFEISIYDDLEILNKVADIVERLNPIEKEQLLNWCEKYQAGMTDLVEVGNAALQIREGKQEYLDGMERLVKKKRPDIRVVLDLPEGEGSDWNDILRKRQEL